MILPFVEDLQEDCKKIELTIFTSCCEEKKLPEVVYQEFRMIQMDFLKFSPVKPNRDKPRNSRKLDFLKN